MVTRSHGSTWFTPRLLSVYSLHPVQNVSPRQRQRPRCRRRPNLRWCTNDQPLLARGCLARTSTAPCRRELLHCVCRCAHFREPTSGGWASTEPGGRPVDRKVRSGWMGPRFLCRGPSDEIRIEARAVLPERGAEQNGASERLYPAIFSLEPSPRWLSSSDATRSVDAPPLNRRNNRRCCSFVTP